MTTKYYCAQCLEIVEGTDLCPHCGWNNLEEEYAEEDPTPWCHVCGSMTSKNCNCGPIADNS